MNKTTYYFLQDTVAQIQPDTVTESGVIADTSMGGSVFTTEKVNDIFEALDRRERELDSLSQVSTQQRASRVIQPPPPRGFDTSSVPYNLSHEPVSETDNLLHSLKERFVYSKDTAKPIFHNETTPVSSSETPSSLVDEWVRNPSASHELRPDWLLGLVIGSLILIAWLKLFYNKFFDQTIQSLTNQQLSVKMFRDQNLFSRRVAFALNLNFVFIGGAFVYLLFGYFQIKPLPFPDLLSFFTYSVIILSLLLMRYLVSHIIGHIFNKHKDFLEYLHQLLLIYKNLGIFLVPLVVGIAYIGEELRIYLVYLGAGMVIAALVFRLLKGVRLLIHKDILIFYMILYLCTLEILPVLIIYRIFSSSILTG